MYRLAIALFTMLLVGPVLAGTQDTTARVQAWLDSWSRLSGRFEQRLQAPTLPSEQVESGRFYIARPDRMRWDYRHPERKLAVTDGVQTWLYVPLDRQVIRGSVDQLRRDSAVSLLLSGTLRLDEAFDIRSSSADEVATWLDLTPRESSDAIQSVRLHAETRTGRILGFEVVDPAGNRVTWSFQDLRLDPRIDDDLFTFQVPRGVEIQDLEAVDPVP